MHVDIFSDPVCPWCYIGKRRLERALAARPIGPVTTTWRVFQLNPAMPAAGMERKAYLESKFGGAAGAREVYDRIAAAGAAEGIRFDFEAIRSTPSTIDSHRLITLAASHPAGQEPLVEALFAAYFLHGEDIGDRATLVRIAGAAGLDATRVRALLETDEGAEQVRREDQRARTSGVAGVPLFLLDRRYTISGAQQPALFAQAFAKLAADNARATPQD